MNKLIGYAILALQGMTLALILSLDPMWEDDSCEDDYMTTDWENCK